MNCFEKLESTLAIVIDFSFTINTLGDRIIYNIRLN